MKQAIQTLPAATTLHWEAVHFYQILQVCKIPAAEHLPYFQTAPAAIMLQMVLMRLPVTPQPTTTRLLERFHCTQVTAITILLLAPLLCTLILQATAISRLE